MAISIKDIREKQFKTQKSNGYNCDEVDDFLDALADQMSVLIRENVALKENAKKAAEESAKAPETPVAAEAAEADGAYDEPSYFKNLEQAMRETLISSQRIADETIADARKKAVEIVSNAQEQADAATAAAKSEVDAAKAEVESLKAEVGAFREEALQSLDLQQAAIEEMRAALKK